MNYREKYLKYKRKYLNLKSQTAGNSRVKKRPGLYISSKNYPEKLTSELIEDILNSFFDFEWRLLGIKYTKNGNTWMIYQKNKSKNWWTD